MNNSKRIGSGFAALCVVLTLLAGCRPDGPMGAIVDNSGGIKPTSAGLDMNGHPVFNVTAAPTTTSQLANKAYVDTAVAGVTSPVIYVQAATATTLPAYTGSGGPGVGYTITANANGVLPAIDSVTLLVGDRFLLQNPAAISDAGVYVVGSVGAVGAAWNAVRDTRLDTAAEFNARPLVVVSNLGTVHGGGQYTYKIRDTITMGTSALFPRRVNMGSARESEGFQYREDFANAVSPGANLNLPGSGLAIQSATITVTAATLQPNNSATEVGLLGVQLTASSATNFGGVVESSSGTGLLGRSYVLGSNVMFEAGFRAINPTLSTGAAEYAVNMGYVNTSAASQVNPANSILFIYDRPTNVNWRACCIVATVATCTDTGIPAATSPYHRFAISHEAGALNVYFDADDVQVASIAYSACPSAATNMFLMGDVFGSVGASTRSGLTLDVMSNNVQWPPGRF